VTRIVLNTHADDAATRVCIDGLGARLRAVGVDAVVGDWSGYAGYDVAVFMGYDDDSRRARSENPEIRVVLADPKQARQGSIDAAREADALLVSSVEQRDAFLRLNRNILVYYMFPPMRPVERIHRNGDRVVVAYHGNRVHLECMVASVKPALEELGRRRPVEFVAIYNIGALGKADLGVPDSGTMRVRHVQWTPELEPGTQVSSTLYSELARADIGIVPSEIPVPDDAPAAFEEPRFFYEPFDHVVRFKASANPGRMYPFAQLGVPVVADFVPSAGQFVVDGVSGLLASSPHGWFDALDTLAGAPDLRQRLAAELRRRVDETYDAQIDQFLALCAAPDKGPPPSFDSVGAAEDELARLTAYPRPRPEGRVRARLRRRLNR
jgi:hypothetical protein